MKKTFILFSFAGILFISLLSSINNSGGSPGGKTGSPADGHNCTQCHAGTPQVVNSWISTTIPSTGYVPNHTYTITLTGTYSGVARFGFELTAENATHNKVGTFVITNTGETKLVNNGHAVTHTGNGITPNNDSKTWSMDWTAPAAGADTITFYAALVAANGNMSTSGDKVFLTSLAIPQDLSIGIEPQSTVQSIQVFPSIAHNQLTIKLGSTAVKSLSIYSVSGQLMKTIPIQNQQDILQFDLSNFAKGSYFIYFETANKKIVKRFIKN